MAAESPAKPNKFARLAEVLRSQKEHELEMRQKQWEQDRQDRLDSERRFLQVIELLAKNQ